MSQIVLCPKCSVRVSVSENQAGRRVRCPGCSQPFLTAAPIASQDDVGQGDDDWLALMRLPTDPDVAAQNPQNYEQFRVRCPKCESIKYVTVSQVGSTVRCGDCHSTVRVPKPPKNFAAPPSYVAATPTPNGDAPPVERQTERSGVIVDTLLKGAEVDVQEAERELSRTEDAMSSWAKSVLSVFIDPGALIHLVVISFLLALPVAATVWNLRLGFATFPFIAIGFSLAMTCGLAIVHSVANGSRTVEEWPTIDLYAWLESSMIVGAALVCSVTPALFLATLFSSGTLVTVGMMLFGAHLVFPFVILSMLETQSVFAPISLDVMRSFKRSRKECRIFYFAAGATLTVPLIYFWFAPPEPIAAGIGAAICVFIAFLYAAILGRFAYAIGLVGDEEQESDEAG